jgi:hypothetical protein
MLMLSNVNADPELGRQLGTGSGQVRQGEGREVSCVVRADMTLSMAETGFVVGRSR